MYNQIYAVSEFEQCNGKKNQSGGIWNKEMKTKPTSITDLWNNYVKNTVQSWTYTQNNKWTYEIPNCNKPRLNDRNSHIWTFRLQIVETFNAFRKIIIKKEEVIDLLCEAKSENSKCIISLINRSALRQNKKGFKKLVINIHCKYILSTLSQQNLSDIIS
jgi:hypothetical protein